MSKTRPTEPVHVLLVEDNLADIRLTKEAFASIEKEVEFTVVKDGVEAVDYIQQHFREDTASRPDIILLDLNLPRADGFTVLETLNEELDYPPSPVLILSSSETEEDIAKSYRKCVNGYLTKPDDISDFMSMAQSIEEFWFEKVRLPPAPS